MFLREWSEYFKKVYSRKEHFKISITFSLLSSLLLTFCGLAVSTEIKKQAETQPRNCAQAGEQEYESAYDTGALALTLGSRDPAVETTTFSTRYITFATFVTFVDILFATTRIDS